MFLLVSLSIFCINTKKSKVNLDNNVRISETINEESSENTANDSYDGDVEEPYGYLGLSFGNDSVINLYCMGYPELGFIYPQSYQYEIQLTYSSGNFTPTNNLYISNEVDISFGNSGGPCFYESNGLYYVRCIVSSDYDNYVAYSKINKVNYNLLMEVIE